VWNGLTRDRVLAAAVRLIDLGFFRPRGEEYVEENRTYGLATILGSQVKSPRSQLIFDYQAKRDESVRTASLTARCAP